MRTKRWLLVADCLSWLLVLGLLLGPNTAGAQSRGIRFEITQVADTTFRFPRGSASWVRVDMTGIAVDPKQRDILVARFRIVGVDSGLVTARVTGATTRVTTEHIALMAEPPKPWYRGITFWAGTVFGIVVGALITG